MDTQVTATDHASDNSPARRIDRKTRASAPVRGFAGPEHTAIEVFTSGRAHLTDPFVMLMDDTLDFRVGQPIGAAHPHAGLETFTLVVEGVLDDADEGRLETGDGAWMSAGRGVVHSENVRSTGHARVLQLWIALPGTQRQAPPELQLLALRALPIRREPGVEARLYSGRTGELVSPTRNRVPMTVVDFMMAPGALIDQALTGTQAGFLYVLDGSLEAGGDPLAAGDVGWFGRVSHADTCLHLRAGTAGARVLLYAGQPLDEPIVHHGPFVAGSQRELAAYFQNYAAGDFEPISRLVTRSGINTA